MWVFCCSFLHHDIYSVILAELPHPFAMYPLERGTVLVWTPVTRLVPNHQTSKTLKNTWLRHKSWHNEKEKMQMKAFNHGPPQLRSKRCFHAVILCCSTTCFFYCWQKHSCHAATHHYMPQLHQKAHKAYSHYDRRCMCLFLNCVCNVLWRLCTDVDSAPKFKFVQLGPELHWPLWAQPIADELADF